MTRAGSVWERCGSPNTMTRELAEQELRAMPVRELIAEAETVGISLAAEGDRLRVRGPQKAEALGRLLLDRKAEVLAVLLSSRPQTAEASMACSLPTAVDFTQSDAERASAVVAEVDAQIEAALLTKPMADKPARRNVLANERQIVRQLARRRDPFLWEWPRALRRLLRRWEEQDAELHP